MAVDIIPSEEMLICSTKLSGSGRSSVLNAVNWGVLTQSKVVVPFVIQSDSTRVYMHDETLAKTLASQPRSARPLFS